MYVHVNYACMHACICVLYTTYTHTHTQYLAIESGTDKRESLAHI